MNYHPKHTSNSRTPVWIGAGVLAAVAIGAIIFKRQHFYLYHAPHTHDKGRSPRQSRNRL